MLNPMPYLLEQDEALANTMLRELARQRQNVELIASENIVSPAVMAAMGSVLTNKYAEGYPGRRYYGGCEFVDETEALAQARACALFGADYANVQPHSGAQANMACYFALCKPGDTVLGMNLDHGGHLTHGSPVNFSGQLYNIVPYSLGPDERIDYDEVERLAMAHKPRLIIAGASAYPRQIDFARFGDIAKKSGAYLMVDMAHIAGLVAAGLHQNPVPYADVVTSTTHKTLRGPRGGLILCKEEHQKAIDKSIFPGIQGGPLMHIIAAKAAAFGEALRPDFKAYQQQVLDNATALSEALLKEGFSLVSGGTDNHLILIDLRAFNITGKLLEKLLDEVHITVNKNAIPDDPKGPMVTSGIRVGTPAITTRGFMPADMATIARHIKLAATDFEANAQLIRSEVAALCARYPIYPGLG